MGISSNGHAGAIDWIQSRFKKHRPATLYFDEVRSPSYTDCLNATCEAVLETDLAGVFHAGGAEAKLRAHDAASGEVLATYDLPAGLHAGPMTYKLKRGGKQFLVVAPGGYAGLSKLGDYVMAFVLPA